jgi:nucleoid DNA-binding protein
MAKKKTKVTKKKTARKTAKKAATKKAAPAYKFAKADKPRSKSEVVRLISEQTDMTRQQVNSVFDCMGAMIAKDLGKTGPGAFNVPGLMKVTVKQKPATKARKGINPFTGEEMMFKAKPASRVVKIRPLKALKDMV